MQLSAGFQRYVEKKYKTTPLDYLMDIVVDEGQELAARMDAAKAALPYCHPKLAHIHMTGRVEHNHEQWLGAIDANEELPESAQIAANSDAERPALDLEAVEVAA